MYYQITNGQAVPATIANASNPQLFIAAQSQAWRHERGIYAQLIEGDVAEPTAAPEQDAIIVPRAVPAAPVMEPVDARLTELQGEYKTATAALCGVLGLATVPVLSLDQIRQGAAQLPSGEAMIQVLAIVTELSNLEMKLCLIDGADALERIV
jgi:hypothetical protein